MSHGGKRKGAGRPKGKGIYGEPTQAIRVPVSMVESIRTMAQHKGYTIPLYSNKISAGFPSPADDHLEQRIDLNQQLIKHPAATFLVKATGESMIGAGIFPDDMLIVDRSLDATHGKIVIAALDGQLTVKRLYHKDGIMKLLPENDAFSDIIITEDMNLHIWGVVTNVIHSVCS